VHRAASEKGLLRLFYRALTLGSTNLSPRSLEIDDRVGRFITVVGIPSAFLLHGYVGFIFGSIKANPWWSTPLMPIVFLFSAIVSGIAAVLLIYIIYCRSQKIPIDVPCLDTMAKYLYYAFIVDFTLEMLDLIHRIYEADESFVSLDFMVPNNPETRQVAEVLQSMVAETGFDLKIRVTEFATSLKQSESGEYQLYLIGWSGRSDPDGNSYIFHVCGQPQNNSGYCDKDVDAWHNEARIKSDPAERKKIYEKITAKYLPEGSIKYLYHRRVLVALSDKVDGYKQMPDGLIRVVGVKLK
jgi:hypothetical protein